MSRIYKSFELVIWVYIFLSFSFSNLVYADDKQNEYNFNIIAYSYVYGIDDAPINTAEHFEKCCSSEYPFTTIKGDLRVTSDNKVIMCHDPGFTLNSDGRIIEYDNSNYIDIHDLTYKQCMDLVYEQKYNGCYVKVCDFETFIKICSDYDKPVFITIRDKYIWELSNYILPIIYEYNMLSKTTINSYTLESLRIIRSFNSSIGLSWVVGMDTLSKGKIDTAFSIGNCWITFEYDGGRKHISEYSDLIDYSNQQGVELYAAIICNYSEVEDLYTNGLSGAQLSSLHDWKPKKEEDYDYIYKYARNGIEVIFDFLQKQIFSCY